MPTDPEKFGVRLTCCGRYDGIGIYGPVDYKSADAFREAYLSGPGVLDPEHPERGGHMRSAIIVAWETDVRRAASG